jgi:Uma2 family endonuclease
MAITQERVKTPLLTYEAYMAEEEINRRYDIIDGVREFMASPTPRHQREQMRITFQLYAYEERTKKARVLAAPSDVLIQRSPLRTRQPDVYLMSSHRWSLNPPIDSPAPRYPAPELVVEILSPSDRPSVLDDKIADYCAVDVKECWVVSPKDQTVEVLQLTRSGSSPVAVYGAGQNVVSLTFPDLSVPVDAIFAD